MTELSELPEGSVRILVAIAACWRVANRPPIQPEMLAVGLSRHDGQAITMLVRRGLLTQEWRGGKRILGTLRPTRAAWELLGESPE